jgi:PAS domain S-box-containing protein
MEIERAQLRQAKDPAAQQVNDLFDSIELAKAVETEEFKNFLDHIPIAIVVSKRMRGEHRIVYANKAFERKTGRTLEEIRGRGWSILDTFRHEDDSELTIGSALLSSDDLLGTFRVTEPKALLCEVYAGLIQNEDGTENYRIAVLVDVTARDRAQREEFARQMREKDLLLKEIEHRVKNNLQLIAVLIRLEARSERLGEKVNLDRLAGRIEAMQFLYKELSEAGKEEAVDLAHYLSQIASGVMRTHGLDGIQLDLSVENAPASINIAMPIGLAVNELLTNAFKYAFVGRQGGTITLHCLRRGEDQYQVMIGDDGVGFPPGVQWPMEGKLGALIVQTLRENAKTDVRFESAPGLGTSVTITFAHRTANRTALQT